MSKLFEPFEAKGLTFKNRLIHVPTTLNMSDPQGYATRRLAAAYGSLAAGGYAAVIVGATCVRRDGLINERMLGLYDEDYVIEFRDTVSEIKNNGSLAGIQLFYGGLIPGLGTTIPLEPGKGWIPGTVAWGPSNKYVIGNAESGVVPTEVYDDIVESFAQAGRRAKEAGFDFLSFHFCHGSLPHTNLSLLANQGRTDKYADRFYMCEAIIKRTQELCGKDFPLVPRLCCDENLEGGYDIEYFAEHYAPRLHALGISVLDCTFGSMLGAPSRRADIHSTEFIGPSFYTPKVVNKDNIQKLRAELQKRGIDMPLIGSANLITPKHLHTMVEEAGADFAGVCRLSLDDPDFPNKMMQDREDEIRLSTHTGASLLQGNIFGKGWAGSAQNPVFGREDEYRIVPTIHPKTIVVVGGGSGGMEYALTADEIGHKVVLFEKAGTLGGAMDWAGNYPGLPNMEMLRYQPAYHRRMIEKSNVEVRLGTDAGVAEILAENPDVVVIATGAKPIAIEVPGLAEARARGAALRIDEAMRRDDPPAIGKRVVVYGAAEGAELALDYKLRGHEVRLIESGPAYAPANYVGSRVWAIMGMMAHVGLAAEPGLALARIEDGAAVFTGEGGETRIEADTVVICAGREKDNTLERAFMGKPIAVHVVGDARTPRSYANAIHEAAYLSRSVK
ncbi:FAD-dependent oxidoreductase [Novosphingobium sp. KCTC 2891]|uniref:oxidoreductase n=1 Tax=Novosphingobium sp. KCTC 2891 TaxID=2989730 RepID=UPI00222228AD|nr:FAD-dependent oxidoreductase [Novosphingobium sp. KCTC 2891]MCW1382685.1 FAD-dependent oxidoreductase [Novosphingobium sp. KCTC 2891]